MPYIYGTYSCIHCEGYFRLMTCLWISDNFINLVCFADISHFLQHAHFTYCIVGLSYINQWCKLSFNKLPQLTLLTNAMKTFIILQTFLWNELNCSAPVALVFEFMWKIEFQTSLYMDTSLCVILIKFILWFVLFLVNFEDKVTLWLSVLTKSSMYHWRVIYTSCWV